MQMAAVLASNDFAAEALSFSDLALQQLRGQPSSLLRAATVRESDILEFQATVRADMKALTDADNSHEEQ